MNVQSKHRRCWWILTLLQHFAAAPQQHREFFVYDNILSNKSFKDIKRLFRPLELTSADTHRLSNDRGCHIISNNLWVTFRYDLLTGVGEVSQSAIFPWYERCLGATQIPLFLPCLSWKCAVCVLLWSPEWWYSETLGGEPSRVMPN